MNAIQNFSASQINYINESALRMDRENDVLILLAAVFAAWVVSHFWSKKKKYII